MVSLISQSDYIQQLRANEYTSRFIDFVLGRAVETASEPNFSNANDLSSHAFRAIQDSDISQFARIYEGICHREPKDDSDWIYNDILMFALTIGVTKFELNTDWLFKVLELRIRNTKGDRKVIAETLFDVLRKNYDNANSYYPLILVIKHVLNFPPGSAEKLNTTYQCITQTGFPYFDSAFLNIITLRAADIVVLSKGLVDWERRKIIEGFVTTFRKRVHQLAMILWFMCLCIAVSISICIVVLFLNLPSKQAVFWDRLISIAPYLIDSGLIVLVFRLKQKLVGMFEGLFYRFYGYDLKLLEGS